MHETTCAFIFFSKRISEDKTKHLQPDWLLNKVMTRNMMLIQKDSLVSDSKLSYKINLEALTMHVNDVAMRQEATIEVGSINPDDTTYGDKVSRISK